MPRGMQLQPLELTPEWLTNSPVTADDFRCITPASTIFRMSFGATSHSRHRESTVYSESEDEESDVSTFLWDDEESDSVDDVDTIEEPEPTPIVRPAEASPEPQPTPTHARAPSTESCTHQASRVVDFHMPWFMQVDPTCLSVLDDQLLQSPLDAFADLCYSQAVRPSDLPNGEEQAGHSYGYSWRRLSRLLSACPDLSQAAIGLEGRETEGGRESESESDTDSEQLASPEQPVPVPGWSFNVYQPRSEREQTESPYRPYNSQTLVAKPLPALPALVPSPPRTPPPCSPPPLRPSDAVTQAQLVFLFANTPPRSDDSVHFFPTKVQEHPPKGGRSRRGTLRISTSSGGRGGGTTPLSPRLGLFQRGLAGIRAGLSH